MTSALRCLEDSGFEANLGYRMISKKKSFQKNSNNNVYIYELLINFVDRLGTHPQDTSLYVYK